MQTKVLCWFREMMDYHEVGKLGKRLPGGGKLSWESCVYLKWMRRRENQCSSSEKQQEQEEKGEIF